MQTRKGSCLCGAVTYTLTAEPIFTRICWCRDCQFLAANGTVNMLVPSDALSISGQTSSYTKTAASGNSVARRFCTQCGTHLFANTSARPQFTVLRVGTLENPSSVKPGSNIWVQSAPEWACMNPELEKTDGQPVPPKPVQS